jgi:LPS O-antigen subunit length determinant protein (WzzB/FepE family)
MTNLEQEDKEIDFFELLSIIWNEKIIMIASMAFALIVCIIYIHSSPRIYEIELMLSPSLENNKTNNSLNLSSLTFLAGVDTGGFSGNNDVQIFEALLTSEELSQRLLKNDNLVKKIYPSEWDQTSGMWKDPRDEFKKNAIQFIKLILTGDQYKSYTPPNAARISTYLKKNVKIAKNKSSLILSLSIKVEDSEFGKELLETMTNETNKIMKESYQKRGYLYIDYYKTKIESTTSLQHRQVLIDLLSVEEQKIMLSEKDDSFIFRTVTDPESSLNYISPNPFSSILLSILIGFIFGSIAAFFNKIRKRSFDKSGGHLDTSENSA